MSVRLLDAGDAAFTVEFGNRIDVTLLAAVQALDQAIARAHRAGELPGLIETMPTFRSLTVFYDPLITSRQALLATLKPMFADAEKPDVLVQGRRWRLPVCYGGDSGMDLVTIAQTIDSTPDEVIALHSGTEVCVYMLGFLPGFPFMGDVHERLKLPRRTEPRVRVPAGSVAIAGGLTAIYPWESPGGWHLLGRCPVPLFDAKLAEAPSLLAAGDRVRFVPVSQAECQDIEAACQAGEIDPARWLADEPTDADARVGA
jgi:inhibitor of KinA